MTQFDDTVKEEVRSRIDIGVVIGRYVNLKQAGATLKGLCPFHKEKTPSFHVNPARGFFHCFGCGKGGDVFSFVEEMEGIGFFEALKMLGEECGVEVALPKTSESSEYRDPPDSDAAENVSKTELFRIHEVATAFFYTTMKESPASIAYLKDRGLKPETVRDFRLGFAGDSWTSLIEHCKTHAIDEAHLAACGLAVCKDNGRCYDRFRNRVIFPLNDLSGRVIGFAGRGMDADTVPKYLNSPETALYKKKHFLFGLYKAREAIRETGEVLVVEGYMDYLSLYQEGIRNVVATSGTALTQEHGRLISRFCRRVTLLFDGDPAGQAAIEKAIFTLVPQGLDISTLSLPDSDDPDSYIRKHGVITFRELLQHTGRWTDFIISRFITIHRGTTPAGKSAVVEALKPLITAIQDKIIVDQFVREIAEKLGLSEQLLQSTLPGGRRQSRVKSITSEVSPHEYINTLEGCFLHILMAKPEFIAEARGYVLPETLTDSLSVNIYSLLLEVFDKDQSLKRILDSTSDPEMKRVISLLMVKDVIEEHVHEELVQKIIHLRKKYLRSRQRECKILMRQEPHRSEELLRLLQDFTTQLHELDGGE